MNKLHVCQRNGTLCKILKSSGQPLVHMIVQLVMFVVWHHGATIEKQSHINMFHKYQMHICEKIIATSWDDDFDMSPNWMSKILIVFIWNDILFFTQLNLDFYLYRQPSHDSIGVSSLYINYKVLIIVQSDQRAWLFFLQEKSSLIVLKLRCVSVLFLSFSLQSFRGCCVWLWLWDPLAAAMATERKGRAKQPTVILHWWLQ